MKGFLQRLTYLRQFNRAKGVKGQVTTLMMLLLVVMLVFVMATFEIGDTSIRATKMVNAADQAALGLASNLATRARMMAEALPCDDPGLNCCEKKNFWVYVFPIIASFGLAGPIGPLEAVLIGNWLDGNPQGYDTALVNAFRILVNIVICVVGVLIMIVYGPVGWVVGGLIVAVGVYGIYQTAFGYNNALQDTIDEIAKTFGDLADDRQRWKGMAEFTVLNALVDNQKMSRDLEDVNANGDTAELIPDFSYWWARRLRALASNEASKAVSAKRLIQLMEGHRNRIRCAYEGSAWCASNEGQLDPTEIVPGYTARVAVPVFQSSDYAWTVNDDGENEAVDTINGAPIIDGRIVRLMRAMYGIGSSAGSYLALPIWEPGPSAADMNNYAAMDCCPEGSTRTDCSPACPTPAGYDWFDDLTNGLREITALVDEVVNMASADTSWPMWISFFYNPIDLLDQDTVYGQLGMYADMLRNLKTAVLFPSAPACVGGWYSRVCAAGVCSNVCGDCPTASCRWTYRNGTAMCIPYCGNCVDSRSPNPLWPCRLTWAGGFFVSRDGITLTEQPTDVLPLVQRSIDTLIARIEAFRRDIASQARFLTSATNLEATLRNYGGVNPIYSWKDSRGQRAVSVEVGPFNMPEWKKKNNWRKTCIGVRNYSDDGSSGGRCWIKVTQTTTPAVSLGVLGAWNPFRRSITKTSKAYYTVDKSNNTANAVGIRNTE
jgi:hypothetical protein